ncbi:MAG: anaerobic ribonucleoside-triphosphate reductase [Selenomonadaceae bacterium]|nr:anaerobic ribonucleoside-triphosphate reductase [Selenomonadaceae bacterium]
MTINGTVVTVAGIENITEQEILAYIERIKEQSQEEVTALDISLADDGQVILDYQLRPQKFERIRRITGYLVGTIDRWNNAKRAEESDRVKHSLSA